jgi:hypothetical protein
MHLATTDQMREMTRNFQTNASRSADEKEPVDFKPVVKFFIPGTNAVWLLTEYDPDFEVFFGLCDLGLGEPELGNVALEDLRTPIGQLGLKAERDIHFEARKTLSEYASQARRSQCVIA